MARGQFLSLILARQHQKVADPWSKRYGLPNQNPSDYLQHRITETTAGVYMFARCLEIEHLLDILRATDGAHLRWTRERNPVLFLIRFCRR